MKKIALAFSLMICVSAGAQLAGEYKIGTGELFPTIGKAVDSLNIMGITGPVHFKIKTGVYAERVSINNFPGESATDTVLFESVAKHPDSVKIEMNAGTKTQNYLVQMKGCERVSFKSISFITNAMNYATQVELTNGASYNRFEDCAFLAPEVVLTGDSLTVIYDKGSGEKENYNQFINNNIEGGWVGLSINGESDKHQIGTKIIGNKFSKQNSTALTLINHDYGVINGNYINVGGSFGIQMNADSVFYLEGNYIKAPNGHGIWISSHDSSVAKGELIMDNNMIITPNGKAITLVNVKNFKLVHNSCYSKNGLAEYTVYLSKVDNGIIQNNLMINGSITGPLYVSELGSGVNFDYNAYYSTSGDIGMNGSLAITSLANWQANGLSPDVNSIFELPDFRDQNSDVRLACAVTSNFHVNNLLSEFLIDHDGNNRTGKAWIGASELRLTNNHTINISGYVTEGGLDTLKHGTVVLFADTSDKVLLDKTGTAVIDQITGAYNFNGVPYSKNLWIKIVPDEILAPDYIEGYHNGYLRWDDGNAIAITDSCNGITTDIFSRKKASFTPGDAKIKGRVTETGGSNKTLGTDPIPGLDVVLDKIPPTKNTIATTKTDVDGYYSFSGLSNGIYVVTIEYEGLPADTIYEVEITNEDSIIDLDYCVDTTEAIHGCAPSITTSNEIDLKVNIYPNPFKSILNIEGVGVMRLTVVDINGKLVLNDKEIINKGTISTENWSEGIYFITTNSNGIGKTEKFIKR